MPAVHLRSRDQKAPRHLLGRYLETIQPRSVEVAKWMIHAAVGEDRDATIEALGAGMIGASDDRAEGVAAFNEKRRPNWPGR